MHAIIQLSIYCLIISSLHIGYVELCMCMHAMQHGAMMYTQRCLLKYNVYEGYLQVCNYIILQVLFGKVYSTCPVQLVGHSKLE